MLHACHFHFSLSCIGEGNGNPLQCSCLENPRDGGAWWAAVCGLAWSRTQLKWLSSIIDREVMEILLYTNICAHTLNRWVITISFCTAKMVTWIKTHQFLFFYKNLVAIETVVVCVSLSCVRPFAAPWTVARQTPLPTEFSRQEYWSEVPFPTPGESSWPRNPNPCLQCLLHWQKDSLLPVPPYISLCCWNDQNTSIFFFLQKLSKLKLLTSLK